MMALQKVFYSMLNNTSSSNIFSINSEMSEEDIDNWETSEGRLGVCFNFNKPDIDFKNEPDGTTRIEIVKSDEQKKSSIYLSISSL